ncbi:hypothetical protein V5O48_018972, partial [Marasmius crinis-equi]
MILYTVQPAPPPDSAASDDEPGWYTMCITNPIVKRKILSTPGYPQPLAQPPGRGKRHKITSSPTGGLGVFATVDMKLGDLVFSERAILMTSPAVRSVMDLPPDSTEAEVRQAA